MTTRSNTDRLVLGAAIVGTLGAVTCLYLATSRRQRRGASPLPPKAGRGQCPYVAATVTEVYVHPVKSCRGYSVESAELTPTGIRYDREWVIVRRKDTKIMTIRELSCLVLLRAVISHTAKKGEVNLRFEPVSGNPVNKSIAPFVLGTVDASDKTSSSEAPQLNSSTLSPSNFAEVNLWGMKGIVRSEGTPVAEYLSNFIKAHATKTTSDADIKEDEEGDETPYFLGRVVSMRNPRENKKYVESIPDPTQQVAMQDFTTLQIVTQESLKDLEWRVRAEEDKKNKEDGTATIITAQQSVIQAERFRPNLVLSGCPAFDEDHWDEFEIVGPKLQGPLQLKVTKLTTRCAIPTVLLDGTRHPSYQPTKYLRENHGADHIPVRELQMGASKLPPGSKIQPIFGLNISAKKADVTATISVGNTIVVTRRIDRTPCFAL